MPHTVCSNFVLAGMKNVIKTYFLISFIGNNIPVKLHLTCLAMV